MRYTTFGSFDEFIESFTTGKNNLTIGMFSQQQTDKISDILFACDVGWLDGPNLGSIPIRHKGFVGYRKANRYAYNVANGRHEFTHEACGIEYVGEYGLIVKASDLISLFSGRSKINTSSFELDKIMLF